MRMRRCSLVWVGKGGRNMILLDGECVADETVLTGGWDTRAHRWGWVGEGEQADEAYTPGPWTLGPGWTLSPKP